jgi:hypothetical protein
MLSCVTNFVTSIDYFGQKVELAFNKERYFKSVIGGIFSIMMYCCCISFIISIGLQLVLKLNPSTVVSTQKESTAPLKEINEEDMLFAFYILTADYEPLNDLSVAEITGYQYVLNRTETDVFDDNVPIELTNCSEYRSYFNDRGFSDDYTKNGLDSGLCFKFSKDQTIIGGNFILDYFSNLYISVKRCDNKVSKVACRSKEEIEAKLKGSYFELYYLDWNVDPNNYDNPFSRYFANYFTILDPISSRFVDLFFKESLITSNTGFLFDSFENKTKVVFDRFREQIDPSNTESEILQLYINISDNKTIHTRIYMKFQDFLANIGGLIQACVVVGLAITDVLTRYDMYEYMMNCLFRFRKDSDLERSLNQVNFDIINNRNLFKHYSIAVKSRSNAKLVKIEPPVVTSNNYILRSIGELNELAINTGSNREPKSQLRTAVNIEKEVNQQLEQKIKQFNDSLISNFQMTFRSKLYKIMNDFLGCKFQRRIIRLYDVAYKKLNGYLDFLKIIKLLKEFRQMKRIVFNDTQYRIFKNHEKPVINEDDEVDAHVESQPKYYELFTKYLKAKEKSENDKVYQRLIDNFDKNLKNIFEKIEEANNTSLQLQ